MKQTRLQTIPGFTRAEFNYLIAFGKPAGHREVAPRESEKQKRKEGEEEKERRDEDKAVKRKRLV